MSAADDHGMVADTAILMWSSRLSVEASEPEKTAAIACALTREGV
jgi:hypothetical protein